MLRPQRLISQVTAFLLVLFAALSAQAHELRPAVADLSFRDDGSSWRIVIRTNLEALLAGIGPEHDDTSESVNAGYYDQLREYPSGELRGAFDQFAGRFLQGVNVRADDAPLTAAVASVVIADVGDISLPRDSFVTIEGALPEGATALTFAWDAGFGPIVLRAPVEEGEEPYSAYLTGGDATQPIPVEGAVEMSFGEAAWQYLELGYIHILPRGLDHILFVVGLFLLSTQMRPLLIQITSFTLAHTVTLALGITGVVTLPGSIVEPIIAASIVYVAVENMLSDRMNKWRPIIVFLFGLLHGLGFAGVLGELGLAPGQFVTSLIAFNIGVELGQLTVVAICFGMVGYWFGQKAWYRRVVVLPGSAFIAIVGAYWVVERTLL